MRDGSEPELDFNSPAERSASDRRFAKSKTHESGIILDVIRALPSEIAILIIEHDMDIVFRFANRITVLGSGAILVEGTPAEIARNQQVREVYLGETVHC